MPSIHESVNPDQQEALLPLGTGAPYSTVEITEVERGKDDEIATFTVRIGGIKIRRVSLRQGRNNSVFLNYPSFQNKHGRWTHYIEIVSPSLDAFVRQQVERAVGEVVR